MDINMLVKRYASGEITRDELKKVLEGIGFSSVITDALLKRADGSRELAQYEEKNNIDASKIQTPFDDCVSKSAPSNH